MAPERSVAVVSDPAMMRNAALDESSSKLISFGVDSIVSLRRRKRWLGKVQTHLALLVLGLEHFPNEVWSLCFGGQSLAYLHRRKLVVLLVFDHEILWNEILVEHPTKWVAQNTAHECHMLNAGEDGGHPGVVSRVVQTAEGLAERQVTNNVKSRIVEPRDHVDRLLPVGAHFAEPLEEQIDVLLDGALLFEHGLHREPARHGPAETRMVLPVRTEDVVNICSVSKRVLPVLLLAGLAMAFEIIGCVRMTYGQDFWCDPYERTVGLVKLQDFLLGLAAQIIAGVRDTCRRPELWPGETAERMEDQVIDGKAHEVDESLGRV